MAAPTPVRRSVAIVLGLLGLVVLFELTTTLLRIVVWRTHWQPGIDFFRRYNKLIENPMALRVAGGSGEQITAVHHRGRRSGRPYVTPVWAERIGRSFYIQLPYGADVDWCRNIMAEGHCVLEHDGVRYSTFAPMIVPAAEAVPVLPPGLLRMQRLGRVTAYLRLDVAPAADEIRRSNTSTRAPGPARSSRRGDASSPDSWNRAGAR